MMAYTRAPQWFKDMYPPGIDYKGKFDDLFGHGSNPQSFNLRVRDVKRSKKGMSAQGGELRASEKEIEEYEYPEKPDWRAEAAKKGQLFDNPVAHQGGGNTGLGKHHGSSHHDRSGIENLTKHDLAVGRTGNVAYTDPLHARDYSPKGKNPGDVWTITTKPSSISVCPKCDTVFKRLLKVCPQCGAEGIVGHFAPYPETLCIGPIKASTREGDTVLDPFAGSGTTGIAAKRLGRKAILIDCVRPYCVMARYNLQRVEYQPELK